MVEEKFAQYLAEFIGTYILTLTIGCNVIAGSPQWAALSIACALTVMIYALGPVSGAHFNPAVSLTMGLLNKLKWPEVGIFCAVQIAGSFLGTLSYMLITGEVFVLGPPAECSWWQAGLAEFFYTFMLCFVVLNATHNRQDQFGGLAIGFVIVAGGYGAGHISGGIFNPAVALGIDLSSLVAQWPGWCLVYILFEVAGAGLAAFLYTKCRPDWKCDQASVQQYDLPEKLLSEFIGTFFLVLTVGFNVLGKSPAVALSVAASLMCMVFSLGTCSGAHFNPCVTAAILASGRQERVKLPLAHGAAYMGVQLFAGICAGLVYTVMERGQTFALGPGAEHSWGDAGLAELFFTFLLCFVVLSVATVRSENIPTQYFGLAVGACIIVGGCAIGSVSGGALNPAVAAGIAVSHLWNGGGLLGFCLYVGAELSGAAIATAAFIATHPSEYVKSAESKPFAVV